MELFGGRPNRSRIRAPSVNLRWTDVALIGVAACFSFLEIMADNLVGLTHPERLIGLMLAVWLSGVAVAMLMVRFGARRTRAVVFVFLVLVVATRGGMILHRFGAAWGWMLVFALIGVTGLLIKPIDNDHLLMAVSVPLAVFLAFGPVLALYQSVANWGEDLTLPSRQIGVSFQETPDMFLVIVDGYGGLVSMEEDFGIETPVWDQALTELGFEIPRSSWSAYPTTTGSVPSLLDMSYPLKAGSAISIATTKHLYSMIGGDNALVVQLTVVDYTGLLALGLVLW